MDLAGVVLKIASRCNLNCSYCYVYNKGDDSYKGQPKYMSRITAMQVLHKIEEHCISNMQGSFLVIFHGGEPLLADKELYRFIVNESKKCKSVKIDFALQTNGVLVDEEWCQLFKELDIKVGFSLDGILETHDKYRLYHSGKGSFNDVLRGIDIFKTHFPDELSVITVMNIDYDPLEIYEYYKLIGVNRWNILLPDFTHDDKPDWLRQPEDTNWADKIIPLFDKWINDTDDNRPSIDIFVTIIGLIIGVDNAGDDHFGRRRSNTLVVETNGSIEATDPLKACGNGFAKAGMNVNSNSFREAMDTPLATLYAKSHELLCEKCQTCPIVDICGGGYIVHRYNKISNFDNPTIYCSDMKRLIVHIYNKVVMSSSELSQFLSPLNPEQVFNHN